MKIVLCAPTLYSRFYQTKMLDANGRKPFVTLTDAEAIILIWIEPKKRNRIS
jgi:hypothetical protein